MQSIGFEIGPHAIIQIWMNNELAPNDDEFGTFIYLFIVIIIISVLMLLLCLCVFFFRGKFQTHSELSHLIR